MNQTIDQITIPLVNIAFRMQRLQLNSVSEWADDLANSVAAAVDFASRSAAANNVLSPATSAQARRWAAFVATKLYLAAYAHADELRTANGGEAPLFSLLAKALRRKDIDAVAGAIADAVGPVDGLLPQIDSAVRKAVNEILLPRLQDRLT